ncbi:zinc finger and BTB domain-containing protein 40-like [Uranotaenia lowii]|uniref:zinc finger and BTB domain-containing protein 40-like n=1 Tax=Uranotaenia lowii TaxID=190385 RepID=UPI0024799F5A|nr:zinc finger and BTB domain-containing protein 40-like [Uranotaenia lowii]
MEGNEQHHFHIVLTFVLNTFRDYILFICYPKIVKTKHQRFYGFLSIVRKASSSLLAATISIVCSMSEQSSSSAEQHPLKRKPISADGPTTSKSIILEKNGEKKILKKIKLKSSTSKLKSATAITSPSSKPTKQLEDSRKSFECTFCKSKFSNQALLKVHFLKHGLESGRIADNPDEKGKQRQGTRPVTSSLMLIECEWCPETFTTMSRAIEHKNRKHSYESKNYFCQLCGRLFPLKVALEQHHNLEHRDEKKQTKTPRLDFICGFCGAEFVSQTAMELHVKTAHNLEKRMMAHPFIPNPSKKVRLNQAGEIISIFYCHLCGSEYMLKFNLLKHVEDHHTAEERCAIPDEMLKCSTCDSVFYNKKAFDAHNVHHKPEDLYVTSEEHRLNIVARVDQDYDYRRVPTALDKALGSSESASALAKRHRSKVKKPNRTDDSTTASSSIPGTSSSEGKPVLDLQALAAGSDVIGMDVLKKLFGEAGAEFPSQ